MRCPTHKTYKGIRPTKRDCPWCHVVYEIAVLYDLARTSSLEYRRSLLAARHASEAASTALYVANRRAAQ